MKRCGLYIKVSTDRQAKVEEGSLRAIVKAYRCSEHLRNGEQEIECFRRLPSCEEAVAKATLRLRRIALRVLEKARDSLLKETQTLAGLKSFEALHEEVKKAIDPIKGIGELTVYDTAHRIGAYLKLRPKFVYLHTGTRRGAKALGLDHRAEKLPKSIFPKEFHCLSEEQIEDCLCIYDEGLRQLKTTIH